MVAKRTFSSQNFAGNNLYPIIHKLHGDRCKSLSRTRATDTVTILDLEQREMGRALNQSTLQIQELAWLPIQGTPGVWAVIHVGKHPVSAPHYKNLLNRTVVHA